MSMSRSNNLFMTTLKLFVAASASSSSRLVEGVRLLRDISYYEPFFKSWSAQHNRSTTNVSHYVHMLLNYAQNDDIITSHNRASALYTLGHNQFSHMNSWEFGKYIGASGTFPIDRDDDATKDVDDDFARLTFEELSLPASVDWTTQGAVTGVKDQGNCGSCWSFSATGALEGAYQIKYGQLVSFSEQNLVSCDTLDSACNGGLMDYAFTWTKSNGGLCTESGYPYTSGSTGQKGTCYTTCAKNANVAPKSYTDVAKNSDDALMAALAVQPVSVAIQANQPAFQLYKSGVLTGDCGSNLDHGVLAVGYGTWTDGTSYYKVKNSWGTGWGMGGYILIQRGKNQRCGECGILCGPPSYPNL
jgi:C1A family cysteine protease